LPKIILYVVEDDGCVVHGVYLGTEKLARHTPSETLRLSAVALFYCTCMIKAARRAMWLTTYLRKVIHVQVNIHVRKCDVLAVSRTMCFTKLCPTGNRVR
jgi:hypothetical protein